MRHQKTGRQLGRNSSHRKAMFRNMVVSLLEHESIKTTDAKAKELRKYAERLITLAKKGDLHARRRARVMVNNKEVLSKLFDTLGARYMNRPGGYTRIVKLGLRPGDNAPLSVIQLVQEEMEVAKKKPVKKVTKPAAKKEGIVEAKPEEAVSVSEGLVEETQEEAIVEASTVEASEGKNTEEPGSVADAGEEAGLAEEDK